jgi:N-methylhydantoinase B
MRFSENGYYVEKYVKCANCGLLIYDQGIPVERDGKQELYCSDWCIEWARLRTSDQHYFQLPIVPPTIKTSRRARSS